MSTHRAGLRLITAAGLTLAATAVLYAFGRTHAPDYASSLFGRHGNDANLLKAQRVFEGCDRVALVVVVVVTVVVSCSADARCDS